MEESDEVREKANEATKKYLHEMQLIYGHDLEVLRGGNGSLRFVVANAFYAGFIGGIGENLYCETKEK